MKRYIPIILLTSIVYASIAVAYPRYDKNNIPRDGDRLHPGIAESETLIMSEIDSAKTVIIDPESITFDGSLDASYYIDGDTVSYVQFATKHRFLINGDTLSYIGYENRASDFHLDRPVRMAVFLMGEGDAFMEEWSGHLLQYGSMLLRHFKGISRSGVEAGWTITDGTDTLRNVTRLRWTLDMAYADPDSIDSAMPDSVASERISEMRVDVKALLSERLLTERTMWFSDDARYPVLTDSRVSRIILDEGGAPYDTVPMSMLAMHNPPSYQYSDTGEEIEKPQNVGKTGGYDAGGGTDGGSPDLLKIGELETTEDLITITLSSRTESVKATLTLFSDTGIILTGPVEVTVGTVARPYNVPVPTGWNGVMLLRVDAGAESHTVKAIR